MDCATIAQKGSIFNAEVGEAASADGGFRQDASFDTPWPSDSERLIPRRKRFTALLLQLVDVGGQAPFDQRGQRQILRTADGVARTLDDGFRQFHGHA
ncbi:MAG: hypothetical protein M3Q69_17160 [Acidobacteriota bacterium]|nr:hypothetical protein [Acidobacteriota bacterium]